MELRQLRYFEAVADELHFGRAAQRLHMSQPPLSAQIARLEKELGVSLFDRTNRQVRLTPAGMHLQHRLRRILGDLDDTVQELREYARGAAGLVSVGFVSSANYILLPQVTSLFSRRYPQVALSLYPLTSHEQLDGLRSGHIDVGIVRDELPAEGFTATALYSEELMVCIPEDHPLAKQSMVQPSELVGEPLITYPRRLMPGFSRKWTEVLGHDADQMNVVREVIHHETALGFVAGGWGVSILPESVRFLLPSSLRLIRIHGAPKSWLNAVRRTEENPRVGDPADRFMECLREVADSGRS